MSAAIGNRESAIGSAEHTLPPLRRGHAPLPVPRRAHAGFTLLEVMLAILLLAVLLAGTYGAIRTAVHAMHSGEAAIDRTNRMRVAQEFMRRQISRIMPLSFGTDDSTNTNIVFEGDGKSMRFVAAMPGYLSKGGPYLQTLTFAGSRRGGKQLLFTDTMLNGYDPEEKPSDLEPSILLDQIDDGHFEYRTLDDQGEMTDWSDKWEDPGVTPLMVRVVVRMSAQAGVEFPVMEIPLVLDVGAGGGNRLRAGGMPLGTSMNSARMPRRLDNKQ